jgi:type I restriction enzyme S subunit
VRKLDTLSARTTTARAHLTAIEKLVERFKASLMRLAFSGELTRDWRATNPTKQSSAQYQSELLEVRKNEWLRREKLKRPDQTTKKISARYTEPIWNVAEEFTQLPEGWIWISTEAISTKVSDGVHKKPVYTETGIPFVMVRDMTSGPGISFENTKFVCVNDHLEFSRRTDPERDDILITKDGTLGIVRRVLTDLEFSIFVSVALVKPANREMSQYLEYAYRAPQVQEQMVGVGTGLQHIHLTDLRKDLIPLAPPEEQREIVRRIETAFAKIDRLAADAAKALKLVGHLDQRILAKAFAGELVPQDPTDEPAETLLARVSAARESAHKPKRKRKTPA